jgi:hypothetical protein
MWSTNRLLFMSHALAKALVNLGTQTVPIGEFYEIKNVQVFNNSLCFGFEFIVLVRELYPFGDQILVKSKS